MLEFCVRDVISLLCYAFFDEKKKKKTKTVIMSLKILFFDSHNLF